MESSSNAVGLATFYDISLKNNKKMCQSPEARSTANSQNVVYIKYA